MKWTERSRKDEAHCPYCRDSINEGAIVQCCLCQALYHEECAKTCLILGCQGRLSAVSSESKKTLTKMGAQDKQGQKLVNKSQADASGAQFAILVGMVFFCIFALAMITTGQKSFKGDLESNWPILIVLLLPFVALAFSLVSNYLFPNADMNRGQEPKTSKGNPNSKKASGASNSTAAQDSK